MAEVMGKKKQGQRCRRKSSKMKQAREEKKVENWIKVRNRKGKEGRPDDTQKVT